MPAPWWRRELRIGWSRPALLAIVALAVETLLLFRGAVLGGRVFYQRDIHLVWHPQVEAFVRAVTAGSWPVWDPCQSFGQPLLADPSAMVLYPMTWLNLIMRPWNYYTVFVVTHTFLSACALFALTRRWQISASGSFVAAALWAASGPLLSLANLWHHFAGAAWIPVVFLAAQRALEARTPRGVFVLTAALTGQILAGSADMCAMTILAMVAYAVVEHRRVGVPLPKAAGRLGLALLCAVGLTAVLWWPALDIVSRSGRANLPANTRTYWSLHPLSLPEFFVPASWTSLPLGADLRERLSERREPLIGSLYLGLPSLALVTAAVLSRDRRRVLFLALLAALAGAMALGRHAPFYGLATTLVPPLKVLRYPVKSVVFVAFAWSLLAGMGFEVWRRAASVRRKIWKRLVLAPVLALALLGVGGAIAMRVGPDSALQPLLDPAAQASALRTNLGQRFAIGAFCAAVCSCLALARMWQRGNSRALALGAGLVAASELAFYHRSTPLAPRDLYTFRPPLLDAILEAPAPRLYSYDYNIVRHDRPDSEDRRTLARVPKGWTLEPATALAQQLSLAPVTAGRWGVRGAFDLDWRDLYSEPLSLFTIMLRAFERSPGHLRLLQAAAVTHVVALHDEGLENLVLRARDEGLYEQPVRLYRVPGSLSRSYVVAGVRVADGVDAVEALADPAFDPLREVLLPDGQPNPKAVALVGTSRILEERPDRIRLETTLAEPGHLVLLDTFDPGWRVTVDGAPGSLLRANVAFRAVPLPAGSHVVEFTYRPASLRRGVMLSLFTLAAALVALLRPAPLSA